MAADSLRGPDMKIYRLDGTVYTVQILSSSPRIIPSYAILSYQLQRDKAAQRARKSLLTGPFGEFIFHSLRSCAN